jgi:hypothetical protein
MKRYLLIVVVIICSLFNSVQAQFTNEILNTSFSNLPTVSSSSSTITNGTGAATGYSWIRTTINNTTTTWPYLGVPGATSITNVVIGTSTSTCYIELPSLTFINGGTVYVEYGSGSNREYELLDVSTGTAVSTGITGGNGTTANRFQVDNSATKPRSTILSNTFTLSATEFNGSKKLRISFVGGSDSRLFKVIIKTTNPGTPPTVTTSAASNITATTASSGGNVTAEGDASVTAKGVVWNTSAAPTVALSSLTNDGSGAGAFTSGITSLIANTKYFYRAYATSSIGTAYGAENNFTTLPAAPISIPPNNITLTGFNANWTAPTQGSEAFTYTLEYSTDNTFTTGVTTVASIASTTTSQSISGLTSGGTYYYRITAVNTTGASAVSSTQTVVLVDGSLATDHFRSVASGNWNAAATWESSHDGTTWSAATSGPDADATAISVRNGHTITVTANVAADDLTIANGASVVVNSGVTFTIANGTAATDAVVSGTLKNIGTITATGTVQINSGAMYDHASDVSGTNITIPGFTWTAGATLKLSGSYSNGTADLLLSPTLSTTGVNFWFDGNITDGTNGRFRLLSVQASLGNVKITNTGAGAVYSANADNTTGTTVASFEQSGGNFFVNRNGGSGTRALTILGDLTISGGTFDVKQGASTTTGVLNVAGNITVSGSGTFAKSGAGTANVILNGSSNQNISLSAATGVINYNINNAAGVTLGSDVTVNGTLTLTNGNLITGNNKVILSSTGTLSGAGASRWIQGSLQRNVAMGATSTTFEIGDAAAYKPVTVAFGNVTTAGDLTASISQTAGDHPDIVNSGIDAAKSVNRFWTITNNSVVFDSYTLTLNFAAADVDGGANNANFIVKKLDGTTWSTPTVGTKTASSIEATGLTSFSQFAVGEAAGTMPVTLSNFKGELQGSINKLNWSTTTEANNKGFEIQRSADGRTFTTIGFVSSKGDRGNSSSALHYSFDDLKPFAGSNYYRLKQIDNDGKSTVSSTINLSRKTDELAITRIYPNPATTELTVVINSPKKETLRMIITDMSGKIVLRTDVNVQSGTNSQSLSTSNFAPGTYLIRLICADGCESKSQHFIRQ